jgi:hypothetical protein
MQLLFRILPIVAGSGLLLLGVVLYVWARKARKAAIGVGVCGALLISLEVLGSLDILPRWVVLYASAILPIGCAIYLRTHNMQSK